MHATGNRLKPMAALAVALVMPNLSLKAETANGLDNPAIAGGIQEKVEHKKLLKPDPEVLPALGLAKGLNLPRGLQMFGEALVNYHPENRNQSSSYRYNEYGAESGGLFWDSPYNKKTDLVWANSAMTERTSFGENLGAEQRVRILAASPGPNQEVMVRFECVLNVSPEVSHGLVVSGWIDADNLDKPKLSLAEEKDIEAKRNPLTNGLKIGTQAFIFRSYVPDGSFTGRIDDSNIAFLDPEGVKPASYGLELKHGSAVTILQAERNPSMALVSWNTDTGTHEAWVSVYKLSKEKKLAYHPFFDNPAITTNTNDAIKSTKKRAPIESQRSRSSTIEDD
jgi:hypothetical protein